MKTNNVSTIGIALLLSSLSAWAKSTLDTTIRPKARKLKIHKTYSCQSYPLHWQEITAESDDLIQELIVNIGDQVNKGQTIAKIDSESIDDKINNLMASQKQARRQLRMSQKNKRTQEKNITTLRQGFQSMVVAKKEINDAANELSRMQLDIIAEQTELQSIDKNINDLKRKKKNLNIQAAIKGRVVYLAQQKKKQNNAFKVSRGEIIAIIADTRAYYLDCFHLARDIRYFQKSFTAPFRILGTQEQQLCQTSPAKPYQGMKKKRGIFHFRCEYETDKFYRRGSLALLQLKQKEDKVWPVTLPWEAIHSSTNGYYVRLKDDDLGEIPQRITIDQEGLHYASIVGGISTNDKIIVTFDFDRKLR